MARNDYLITAEQVKLLQSAKSPYWPKVFKYAKLMEQGVEFPPVKIHFNKEKNRWMYNDGRHRVLAAKMVNKGLFVRSKRIMGEKNESTN